MPAKGGPFATVVVIQEIFGVHEHIKDVCRRLAKSGYFAVAPALYARQGDVSKLSDVQEIIKTVVSKVPDEQVASDLDATVAGTTPPLHPKRVLDLHTDLKVPVLGLYGAADQGIAVADVEKLRDDAKRLHKKVEIVI